MDQRAPVGDATEQSDSDSESNDSSSPSSTTTGGRSLSPATPSRPFKIRRYGMVADPAEYVPYIDLTNEPPNHYIVRRNVLLGWVRHHYLVPEAVLSSIVGHFPHGMARQYTQNQMRCARCYRLLESRCNALVCGCVSGLPLAFHHLLRITC